MNTIYLIIYLTTWEGDGQRRSVGLEVLRKGISYEGSDCSWQDSRPRVELCRKKWSGYRKAITKKKKDLAEKCIVLGRQNIVECNWGLDVRSEYLTNVPFGI